MDSTEQGLDHSTTEQPEAVISDEATTQSQTLEKDNTQEETISKAEYKKLQAEYTKSRQELSEFKKTSELSSEDKAAINFIKDNGFVTKDELENMSARQAHEAKLTDIIAANPDLKQFESAIRTIGKDSEMAYEDIIQKYGFKSGDKLSKARSQGDVRGAPEKKAKSIKDMTPAEYTKYKAAMGWTENKGSFS